MLLVLEYLESGKGSARQPEGLGVILVEAGVSVREWLDQKAYRVEE